MFFLTIFFYVLRHIFHSLSHISQSNLLKLSLRFFVFYLLSSPFYRSLFLILICFDSSQLTSLISLSSSNSLKFSYPSVPHCLSPTFSLCPLPLSLYPTQFSVFSADWIYHPTAAPAPSQFPISTFPLPIPLRRKEMQPSK